MREKEEQSRKMFSLKEMSADSSWKDVELQWGTGHGGEDTVTLFTGEGPLERKDWRQGGPGSILKQSGRSKSQPEGDGEVVVG